MRSKYFIHPIEIETNSKLGLAKRLRHFINEPSKCSIPPHRIINSNRSDIYLDEKDITFSSSNFSDCFEKMRRNKSAEWDLEISPLDVDTGEVEFFTKIFLLNSGDIVVVTALLYENECELFKQGTSWYQSELLPNIKRGVCAILASGKLTKAEEASLDFATPIHTIFGFSKDDHWSRSIASHRFKAEGLDMEQRQISIDTFDTWRIFGGWSYSAIERSDFGEEFYFVSVMIRLQMDWFVLRRWRRKVLSDESGAILSYRYKTLKSEHKSTHEMLYLLQKKQQETFDFRANLKPWLADVFDGVSHFWAISEDFEFIKSSTSGLRDLISFSIQEKELSQSRMQSRILYLIAALDTFALTGFVLGLLSFERNSSEEFSIFNQFVSQEILIGIILVNVTIFTLVFLLAFWRTR